MGNPQFSGLDYGNFDGIFTSNGYFTYRNGIESFGSNYMNGQQKIDLISSFNPFIYKNKRSFFMFYPNFAVEPSSGGAESLVGYDSYSSTLTTKMIGSPLEISKNAFQIRTSTSQFADFGSDEQSFNKYEQNLEGSIFKLGNVTLEINGNRLVILN